MSRDTIPFLDCLSCGEDLIPAHGRACLEEDGGEHRDGCRCPYCQWVWYDDREPVRCKCGALVRVKVEDETAYAVEVRSE
jgi:hypothetical protein